MENGINYYVIEDILYNKKNYILAVQCDTDKDDVVDKDGYIVLEVNLDNNELITANIDDDNLAVIVTNELLKKLRNSKK